MDAEEKPESNSKATAVTLLADSQVTAINQKELLHRLDSLTKQLAKSTNSKSRVSDKDPWWHNKWYVAALSAGLAAAVPLTTAVTGAYQLVLSREKQAQDFALAQASSQNAINQTYLKIAIDKDTKPEDRLIVLRFLSSTLPTDSPMKRWADQELLLIHNSTARSENTISTPPLPSKDPDVSAPVVGPFGLSRDFLNSYPVKKVCLISSGVSDELVKDVSAELKKLLGDKVGTIASCSENGGFEGSGSTLRIELSSNDSGRTIQSHFHAVAVSEINIPEVRCSQSDINIGPFKTAGPPTCTTMLRKQVSQIGGGVGFSVSFSASTLVAGLQDTISKILLN